MFAVFVGDLADDAFDVVGRVEQIEPDVSGLVGNFAGWREGRMRAGRRIGLYACAFWLCRCAMAFRRSVASARLIRSKALAASASCGSSSGRIAMIVSSRTRARAIFKSCCNLGKSRTLGLWKLGLDSSTLDPDCRSGRLGIHRSGARSQGFGPVCG
jgi:hypothetical protein